MKTYVLHVREIDTTEEEAARQCEVHDWTLDDFRTRFVPLLRQRHGKGGVNCCTTCIAAARDELKALIAARAGEHG